MKLHVACIYVVTLLYTKNDILLCPQVLGARVLNDPIVNVLGVTSKTNFPLPRLMQLHFWKYQKLRPLFHALLQVSK